MSHEKHSLIKVQIIFHDWANLIRLKMLYTRFVKMRGRRQRKHEQMRLATEEKSFKKTLQTSLDKKLCTVKQAVCWK